MSHQCHESIHVCSEEGHYRSLPIMKTGHGHSVLRDLYENTHHIHAFEYFLSRLKLQKKPTSEEDCLTKERRRKTYVWIMSYIVIITGWVV